MAITAGNVTVSSATYNVSSRTFSHNNNGDFLVVGFGGAYGIGFGFSPVTGVTYNGVAMTQVGTAQGEYYTRHMSVWYLVNPAAGTNNVVVTFTGGDGKNAGIAQSFSGVHQSTPVGTAATGNYDNGAVSGSVSSAVGELVIDFVGLGPADTVTSATPGGGQTEIGDIATGTASGDLVLCGSLKDGAASVTMEWTPSGGYLDSIHKMVPLKPASAAETLMGQICV